MTKRERKYLKPKYEIHIERGWHLDDFINDTHTIRITTFKNKRKIKMRTIQEYQQLAKRTCPDLGSLEDNLLHMRLGVYTEIGELLDIIKKNLAYKKTMDVVNIGEEIADIAWYVVNDDCFNGCETYATEPITKALTLPTVIIACEDILLHTAATKSHANNKQVLANLASIATYFQLDFMQLLQNNIDKLKVRYPDKFDEQKALERNLDYERKELEK